MTNTYTTGSPHSYWIGRNGATKTIRKRLLHLVAIFSILACIGCAGTKQAAFQNKIQSMSDDDLVSYYQGITDRLRDVERDNNRERNKPDYNPENLAHPRSNVYFGTQEYSLMKKQKSILEELNRRGIKP